MALRATNSDEGVRGAGLAACRRLSSRRAERKLGGGPEGPSPRTRLQWSGGYVTQLMARVVDRQRNQRRGGLTCYDRDL